jgi:sulfate permease, SulP family
MSFGPGAALPRRNPLNPQSGPPTTSTDAPKPGQPASAATPWRRDLLAGTVSAVVLIPQAIAYAMVAGVEPIHGLYASFLPLLVYAAIGRSRELAVGPGALDTLLVGTAIAGLALGSDAERAGIAALLAGLVAVVQLGLAAMQAGFLVNFLSRPVISGFTSAAAIVIALSQARNFLGLPERMPADFVSMAGYLARSLSSTHVATALCGVVGVVILLVLKRLRPKWPGALLLVTFSIAASHLLGLTQLGVATVGSVPMGLPDISLPPITWELVVTLFPTAISTAMVGYLTVISIAQTFANRNHYTISPTRELAALGGANVAAALSSGFPVSASFSRSAVHASSSPTSPRALVVSAAWVALTLTLLAGFLAELPRSTLAAIIMVAVMGLFEPHELRRLWKVKRDDAWLLVVTFAATLGLGIERGMLFGVAASLIWFMFRTTRPHAAVLGRVRDTMDYRNIANYPDAHAIPGIIVIRIDAQFYFGNVTFLRELLQRLEAASSVPVSAVIIEACSLNQLDSSANDALRDIVDDYHKRGIRFAMATVKQPVARVMRASGLWDAIGETNFYMNVHDAVIACRP